jgi:hypothetical protein
LRHGDERSAYEHERPNRHSKAPVGALKLRQPLFNAKQPPVKLILGRLSECRYASLSSFSAPDAELGKSALVVIVVWFYISLRE